MVIASPRFLVVGLGNLPYPLTRHSIGHLAVDSLASRLGAQFVEDRRLRGLRADTNVQIGENSVSLTLLKPRAVMNMSGPPVANALRSLSIPPSSLIVIHDYPWDKPNFVSRRFGGSANGHHGIRSIIVALDNNTDFYRLRVGIGKDHIDTYVVDSLSQQEVDFWGSEGQGTERAWKAIEKIIGKSLKPSER